MMSKILRLASKIFFILLLSISFSKAELINPNSSIKPAEVVKIQLTGLKNNDKEFLSKSNFEICTEATLNPKMYYTNFEVVNLDWAKSLNHLNLITK